MVTTSDKSPLEANQHAAALETIGRFVEALYDVDSPFEFATTLVKATAQHYSADIATLFRVSPSKTELVAEAGYDQKGELLQARALYNLPWDATSENDMPGGGPYCLGGGKRKPALHRDPRGTPQQEHASRTSRCMGSRVAPFWA